MCLSKKRRGTNAHLKIQVYKSGTPCTTQALARAFVLSSDPFCFDSISESKGMQITHCFIATGKPLSTVLRSPKLKLLGSQLCPALEVATVLGTGKVTVLLFPWLGSTELT